jgi:hypothetical protein
MPLKSPFRFLIQFLSGYDIFISYRWQDATSYAEDLAEQLESKGFNCFLDKKGLRKGELISDTLRRAIRRSTMFVLVVTENVAAPDSVWIPQELEAFPASGKRALVPIDVGGSLKLVPLDRKPWDVLGGRNAVSEKPESLRDGKSSQKVVTEIESAFTFKRQEAVAAAKVFRSAMGVALAVCLMIAVAVNRTIEARNQQAIAGEKTRLAEDKSREAEEKAKVAEEKKAEALKAEGRGSKG